MDDTEEENDWNLLWKFHDSWLYVGRTKSTLFLQKYLNILSISYCVFNKEMKIVISVRC